MVISSFTLSHTTYSPSIFKNVVAKDPKTPVSRVIVTGTVLSSEGLYKF